MSGNPSWWSMIMNGDNNMHPAQISPPSHHDQFAYNPLSISHDNTTSSLPNSNPSHQADQDFRLRSWSQLLLGGGEEEQELRFDHANLFQQQKKFGNWEEQQVLNLNNTPSFSTKQEAHVQSSNYGYVNDILNFSAASKTAAQRKRNHSTECKSSGIVGGVSKKAGIQHDHELSSQPVLKVRKEKVMARITALHQLVSPFGKTDQASVLSEAISCIRFLQAQIEAYSSPYMQNASGNTVHHQHADSQGFQFEDLQSRGLCLVPVSNCTQHLENDNGADYWGPDALGGGF